MALIAARDVNRFMHVMLMLTPKTCDLFLHHFLHHFLHQFLHHFLHHFLLFEVCMLEGIACSVFQTMVLSINQNPLFLYMNLQSFLSIFLVGVHLSTQMHVCIGAERLLRHLHKVGIPICLATSSDAFNFNLKTTNHNPLFNEVFHHKVTGE